MAETKQGVHGPESSERENSGNTTTALTLLVLGVRRGKWAQLGRRERGEDQAPEPVSTPCGSKQPK